MIDYKEISLDDWNALDDPTGYYCITSPFGSKYFRFDYMAHNEYGPANYYKRNNIEFKEYFLYGQCYGDQSKYSDEEWIRFCKLKAFH